MKAKRQLLGSCDSCGLLGPGADPLFYGYLRSVPMATHFTALPPVGYVYCVSNYFPIM